MLGTFHMKVRVEILACIKIKKKDTYPPHRKGSLSLVVFRETFHSKWSLPQRWFDEG